ncbi:uncharacterized protein [Lolium perenne]|uniref:uncharacterized protein n=1 Tax=Lolium perenne TaxID=4522 RepID=UPI003A99E38D
MVAGAVADQQAQGCSGSAKRCGNLTISDPFWLVDLEKGKSCGAPGFEVFCEKNTPSLQSPGRFGFTIINITYEKHNLRAIDKGKLELMQASNTCHIPHSRNTSVKLRPPFRISPANLDLVMYNCKEEVAGARSYDEMSDYASYAVEGCDALVIPVLGSSGNGNASNYEQLIRDCFLVTWDDLPLPLARKFTHP